MTKALLDTSKLNLDFGIREVTVSGISSTGVPVAGRGVIVHAPFVKSEFYPYEYISVPEMFLQVIEGSIPL